jgi:hypothetical protein
MSWTLEDLFGAGATYNPTNKTITFDADSLLDGNNQPWIQNTTPTASQVFAALLKHAERVTINSGADKTKGIVAQQQFGESIVIETRDGQSQIYQTHSFRVYQVTPSVLTSGIDPDNVL